VISPQWLDSLLPELRPFGLRRSSSWAREPSGNAGLSVAKAGGFATLYPLARAVPVELPCGLYERHSARPRAHALAQSM